MNFSSSLRSLSIGLTSVFATQVRFATKKAAGSTKNGRDSIGKRLGVKILGDQRTSKGNILVRQRGLTYGVGENVGLGKDYTIYSLLDGWVKFTYDPVKKRSVVNVTGEDPRLRLRGKRVAAEAAKAAAGQEGGALI